MHWLGRLKKGPEEKEIKKKKSYMVKKKEEIINSEIIFPPRDMYLFWTDIFIHVVLEKSKSKAKCLRKNTPNKMTVVIPKPLRKKRISRLIAHDLRRNTTYNSTVKSPLCMVVEDRTRTDLLTSYSKKVFNAACCSLPCDTLVKGKKKKKSWKVNERL